MKNLWAIPVIVERNPVVIGDKTIEILVIFLPKIVIKALTCECFGGLILPGDIDMWLKKEPFEFEGLGISISVPAFPERVENIDKRRENITGEVKRIVPPNAEVLTEIILSPPPGKLF